VLIVAFLGAFFSDSNVWYVFRYKINPNTLRNLAVVNLVFYLVAAFLLRQSLEALLYLSLNAFLIDIINFRRSFFIWRALVIAGAAVPLLWFGSGSMAWEYALPAVLIFILIKTQRIVREANRLILEESQRWEAFYLNNHIKQLEFEQKTAYQDPLTQLLNRRGFEAESFPIFRECHQNGRPFALLELDLDYFKKINDTYGHNAGDEALKTFAEAVNGIIRPTTDILARVGGEEFVITTIGVDDEEKLALFAERVRKTVEDTCWDGDKRFTVSIGAVLFPTTAAATVEELLGKADAALYQAKADGRNRVVISRGTD
jgi:diguanylate cyclase (GGDEF)-like protein